MYFFSMDFMAGKIDDIPTQPATAQNTMMNQL
jgi:hypothetical protein